MSLNIDLDTLTMKFLTTVVLFTLSSSAAAFGTSAFVRRGGRSASALFVSPDTFYRAVQCAEGNNKCDIDELEKLATELEEFVGCNYEKEEDDCNKEMQDRIDVAEILRMQIELKHRVDYLKEANLFASDVKQEHDMEERRKFKERLQFQRKEEAGEDLGLW